jgi:hypothetical protein
MRGFEKDAACGVEILSRARQKWLQQTIHGVGALYRLFGFRKAQRLFVFAAMRIRSKIRPHKAQEIRAFAKKKKARKRLEEN